MKIKYKYWLFLFIFFCSAGDVVVCEYANNGQDENATFSVSNYFSLGHWIKIGNTTDEGQVFAKPKNEFKDQPARRTIDIKNLENKLLQNVQTNFKKAKDRLDQLLFKTTTAKPSHKPRRQLKKKQTRKRRTKPVNRVHVIRKDSKKSYITIAVKPNKSDEQKSTKEIEPKKSTQEIEPKKSTQEMEPKKSTQEKEPKKSTQAMEPKKSTQQIENKNSTQQMEPKKSTQHRKPMKSTKQRKRKKSTQQINWQTKKDKKNRFKSDRKHNSKKRIKENIRNKNSKERLLKIKNKKPMSSENRWRNVKGKNPIPKKRKLMKSRHSARQRKLYGKNGTKKEQNPKSEVSDRRTYHRWTHVQMARFKEKCKQLSKRILERSKAMLYSNRKEISNLISKTIELEYKNYLLQKKLRKVPKSHNKTEEIEDKEDIGRFNEIISKFKRISKDKPDFLMGPNGMIDSKGSYQQMGSQQNRSLISGVFVSPRQAPFILYDKALWIGLAIGIIAVLLCFVLCYLLCKCAKKLKSQHGIPLKGTLSIFDVRQPKRIDGKTLTQANIRDMPGKINGSQYVANFEDKPDTSQIEWSSEEEEEEVYNATVNRSGHSLKISKSLSTSYTSNSNDFYYKQSPKKSKSLSSKGLSITSTSNTNDSPKLFE